MNPITAVLFDVGGVLGTNGWDRNSRRRAVERFHLDWEEFADRHELSVTAFETGHLALDQYLERTVFYRPRDFSRDDFKQFMFEESQPFTDSLAVLADVAGARKYFLATLNNESLELNLYRIQKFGLRAYFDVFFSSCFLGVKKPDEAIYRLALKMTQRAPEECVFIDDRALNLECARACCGLRTIQFQNAEHLREDLKASGVDL
jgi:putative hydrolase of the HAD superfamily